MLIIPIRGLIMSLSIDNLQTTLREGLCDLIVYDGRLIPIKSTWHSYIYIMELNSLWNTCTNLFLLLQEYLPFLVLNHQSSHAYHGHYNGAQRRTAQATVVTAYNGRFDICYTQVGFSITFIYSCTDSIRSTWIALAGSIGIVLPSGGSVAFLYGFIFCVLCNFCLGASLGELSSIWPTAGGQYHYVFALCTERWQKVMVRPLLRFQLHGGSSDSAELLGWLDQHCWMVYLGHYWRLFCRWDQVFNNEISCQANILCSTVHFGCSGHCVQRRLYDWSMENIPDIYGHSDIHNDLKYLW